VTAPDSHRGVTATALEERRCIPSGCLRDENDMPSRRAGSNRSSANSRDRSLDPQSGQGRSTKSNAVTSVAKRRDRVAEAIVSAVPAQRRPPDERHREDEWYGWQ